MPKPEPAPIDPADLPRLARDTMAAAKFPVLASIDGDRPRARPVSPVRTDGFTVCVANLRAYHKTQEIAANPHVELCYVDDHHNQVRIEGSAEVLTDRPLLEQIWAENPLMRQFLGSLDNPQLVIYRVAPARVRYMREWALSYHDVPLN
ncbi:MAG TPA: pyridoxamine 5'-phosphate oxidase family protein [Humisphaera sp.]